MDICYIITLRESTATDTASRSRGWFARGLLELAAPKERARGRPGARCTRGLACKCTQRTRTRAYRFSGGNPAFPAQWLYGLYRALPGERALLPPSPHDVTRKT